LEAQVRRFVPFSRRKFRPGGNRYPVAAEDHAENVLSATETN